MNPLPIRDKTNSEVFIFKFCNKSINFVYLIYHQFAHFINPQKPVRGLMNNLVHLIYHQLTHFINPQKPVRGLMNNFVRFIHPYMNRLPIYIGRP